jgi:glycosyltransferase involved in cell wall biosynthesis
MKHEEIVSICMITYNHEKYISQAIESILLQRCNFKIEIVIGEDCSIDNTRLICSEYAAKHPQIKLLPSASNLGIIPNFIRTLQAGIGKYIAICEGDDYWTDPYKLQKQVDFLEANEDFGLIYTDAAIYIQESNTFNKSFSAYFEEIPSSGNIFHHLLLRNCIQTLTVVARKTSLMEAVAYLGDSINMFKMGDYPMWLEIARNSKIKYLNDITAVYRKSANSASSYYDIGKRYDFLQSCYDMQFYFCKKYNILDVQKKVQIEYNRFLCHRAFDLKEKITDKNILQSFDPISIRDRLIKISLESDFINFFVRILLKMVAVYKKRKNKRF